MWVSVHVPLLIHPTDHFFLGIGPEVFEDISRDVETLNNRRRFRGITSIVGGWF